MPFAALAAGGMSPDLPYYLPGDRWAPMPATHSFWGVLSWDLLFGLAIWAAWCLARQPLHDLAPRYIRSRWHHPAIGFQGWKRAPVAVLIGSITHVVWDEFTHAGRFGTTHLSNLANTYPSPLGPLEGYRYLQYASGVLGLVVLLWAWQRIPRVAPGTRRQSVLTLFAPGAVTIGGVLAVFLQLSQAGWDDWRSAGFAVVTSTVRGIFVVVAILSAAQLVVTRWWPARAQR